MEIHIQPELERFLRTPETLIGTRWMAQRGRNLGPGSREYQHAEVVSLEPGDRVRLVTAYSNPLQHWLEPIASMLVESSSFFYLGQAQDFRWVRTDRLFHHPRDRTRVYRIRVVDSRGIEGGRVDDGTEDRIRFTWVTVKTIAQVSWADEQQILRGDQPTPSEEGTNPAPVEPEVERPTAWERISKEE
jgi:hypothetical protein